MSEFDITKIYTPLAVSKLEARRRWNDPVLKQKVIDFWGGSIPDVFKHEPQAVLSRHIISPNQEFGLFYSLAQEIGLAPLGLEGANDIFCTINPDKVALGKMVFLKKEGMNGRHVNRNLDNVIDLKNSEGKRFCEIKTLWGENLVDFHHRLLNTKYPDVKLFDDFQWLVDKGFSIKPKKYYKMFFALFVCFGVLFENFLVNKNEINFTKNIISPVFSQIEDIFGVRPLITPITSIYDEAHSCWRCYPYALKEIIEMT